MGGGQTPSSVRLILGLSDKSRILDKCVCCVHVHVCTHILRHTHMHTQTVRPTKGPRAIRQPDLIVQILNVAELFGSVWGH